MDYNPEESLSDGTNVDNNDNFIPFQWILLCVFFPAYTLLVFYSKTCTNKVKKPTCDCKHSDGIYTVSISAEEHWNALCVLCKYIAGYLTVPFLLVSLIMSITTNLPSQRYLFEVIVIEFLACIFLLCCFCHGGFFNSTTSCKEIIQDIRRQKVKLLTSLDGTMQPLTSSLYHYEDVSFFEDLSAGDQNDGRIVHFDVKVCVKIHTSMVRNFTVASKCVLQNRMFDPNSENYMLFSKPRSKRFRTLSEFRERFRLFFSCSDFNCAWKWCVNPTTLHIIKCVYLPASLKEYTGLLYIRVQDLNIYLEVLRTTRDIANSCRTNLDQTVIDL